MANQMSVRLAALAFSALPLSAPYADTDIVLTLGSRHSAPCTHNITPGACVPYNERNYGVGVARDVSQHVALMAGTYENSYLRRSVYAGVTLSAASLTLRAGSLRISPALDVAYLTGYEGIHKYPAMVLPILRVGTERFAARVGYLPRIGGESASVVTLQLMFRVGR